MVTGSTPVEFSIHRIDLNFNRFSPQTEFRGSEAWRYFAFNEIISPANFLLENLTRQHEYHLVKRLRGSEVGVTSELETSAYSPVGHLTVSLPGLLLN